MLLLGIFGGINVFTCWDFPSASPLFHFRISASSKWQAVFRLEHWRCCSVLLCRQGGGTGMTTGVPQLCVAATQDDCFYLWPSPCPLEWVQKGTLGLEQKENVVLSCIEVCNYLPLMIMFLEVTAYLCGANKTKCPAWPLFFGGDLWAYSSSEARHYVLKAIHSLCPVNRANCLRCCVSAMENRVNPN